MSDSVIAKLFSALDHVILEPSEHGCYRALVQLPGWWLKVDTRCAAAAGEFLPSEALPFLSDFLRDAEPFWSDQRTDWLRSGLWQEVFADGESCYLEALATTMDGRSILVIRRADEIAHERLSLIQKGRDNKLAYQLDIAQRWRSMKWMNFREWHRRYNTKEDLYAGLVCRGQDQFGFPVCHGAVFRQVPDNCGRESGPTRSRR